MASARAALAAVLPAAAVFAFDLAEKVRPLFSQPLHPVFIPLSIALGYLLASWRATKTQRQQDQPLAEGIQQEMQHPRPSAALLLAHAAALLPERAALAKSNEESAAAADEEGNNDDSAAASPDPQRPEKGLTNGAEEAESSQPAAEHNSDAGSDGEHLEAAAGHGDKQDAREESRVNVAFRPATILNNIQETSEEEEDEEGAEGDMEPSSPLICASASSSLFRSQQHLPDIVVSRDSGAAMDSCSEEIVSASASFDRSRRISDDMSSREDMDSPATMGLYRPRPRTSVGSTDSTESSRERRISMAGSASGHRSPMSKRRSDFLEKLMGNSVSGQAMAKNVVLSALPVSARSSLLQHAEELVMPIGSILMEEADPSDCMFFITEGSVAIVKAGVEIARQENGGVLGEMGILTGQRRTATVKCVSEVRVLRISAAHFLRVTDSHPVMYRALLREMVDKVQSTQAMRIKQSHVIQDALDILTRTVSDEVLSLLVNDTSPIELLKGRTDDAAILFFDIRGFSSAAEKMQPQDLLQALNEHLQLITYQVQSSCGAIVNFIGDAVLAVFNTPVHIDLPADAALECYKNCRYELERSRESRLKEGKVCFEMGGGLNFGLVVAGAIGSENRFTYSVLGDEVNLAARLESLTRHYPVDMIFSEALYDQLSQHYKDDCVMLDYVQVKGRVRPVHIYTLALQTEKLQICTSTRDMNIDRLARRVSNDTRSGRTSPTALATSAATSTTSITTITSITNITPASTAAATASAPPPSSPMLTVATCKPFARRMSLVPPSEEPGPCGLAALPEHPNVVQRLPPSTLAGPLQLPSQSCHSSPVTACDGEEEEEEEEEDGVSAGRMSRSLSLPSILVNDAELDSGTATAAATAAEATAVVSLEARDEQEERRFSLGLCDLALFRAAQTFYLKGEFARAEALFIRAGGRLGYFFVDRCRECAESPHPWPGYYTWDVK